MTLERAASLVALGVAIVTFAAFVLMTIVALLVALWSAIWRVV